MGMVNALKTGDPTIDMIIAMCIPVILRFLFKFAERSESLLDVERWIKLWFRPKPRNVYERRIEYRRSRDPYGGTISLDSDTQNPVLLKAIQLYVHHKCNLDLMAANLDLTSLETNSNAAIVRTTTMTITTIIRTMTILLWHPQQVSKLSKSLRINVWHTLGEFGSPPADVLLCMNEQEQGDSERGASLVKEADLYSLHL